MDEIEIFVEWSKGSRNRLEKEGGRLVAKQEDAPAPANYGFIPDTQNPADGSELDAVLLGPPVPAGTRARGQVVGLIVLADGDHKLILSPSGRPPSAEEVRRLLAWFPPERKAHFVGSEKAWALLRDTIEAKGGNHGGG